MADYINREAFLAAKRKLYCFFCERRIGVKDGLRCYVYDIGDAPCRSCGIGDVLDDVEDYPAADVVERKKGEWKPFDLAWGRSVYYCTVCQEGMEVPTSMGVPLYQFCPNCGAEMRGESNG